jgi:hypothetical protein
MLQNLWRAATAAVRMPIPARRRSRYTISTENDYKVSRIYRNTTDNIATATLLDNVKGTAYSDEDDLTPGSTYYYWVTHVDTSGNESAKYPAVNGVAAGYRLVEAGDTDATALAAPSGLALALNYQDVDADGTVDTTYKATWTALTGAVRYEIEVSRSSTSGGTYTVIQNIVTTALQAAFKVVTGKFYKARIRGFSFNGTPGTWSALTAAANPAKKSLTLGAVSGFGSVNIENDTNHFYTPVFLYWDTPTDADYAYTEITLSPNDDIDDPLAVRYRSSGGGATVFHDFVVAWIFLRHIDTSGNVAATYPASGGHRVESRDEIDTRDLAVNAVNVWQSANPGGSVTINTGSPAAAITCTSDHTAWAEKVKLTAEFRNVSGGTRTFDVTWRADGSNLRTVTVTLPDNQAWAGVHLHAAPSGASTDYDVLITPGATNVTLAERYMITEAIKR